MDKLMSCPFCGGNGNIVDEETERDATGKVKITWNIECEQCGTMLGYERWRTREKTISAWNRRASDWRSMETAPKDGTKILLWIGRSVLGAWSWSDDSESGCWRHWESMEYKSVSPTYWQPLPSSPEGDPA